MRMQMNRINRLFLLILVALLIYGINNDGFSNTGTEAAFSSTLSAKSQYRKSTSIAGSLFNDKSYAEQWYIKATRADLVWRLPVPKKQIKVALVDSGIDSNHPELKNRVLKELGYNFIDETRDTSDSLGHGTQLAGIIAAEGNNGLGVVGITGSYNVKIIPVKVLDKNGKGPSDIVAKGIEYSADIGADLINVSIDFQTLDTDIKKAIEYARSKGALVIVAAGNSSSNCDKYSPAGDDGAFTVAAVDQENKRLWFSSYGTSIKVAAPGQDILTTIPGGKYTYVNGTSMAAPIVTGIAAMLMASKPTLSASAIEKSITNTATDIMAKGKDKYTGYGIINAYNAMNYLKKQ